MWTPRGHGWMEHLTSKDSRKSHFYKLYTEWNGCVMFDLQCRHGHIQDKEYCRHDIRHFDTVMLSPFVGFGPKVNPTAQRQLPLQRTALLCNTRWLSETRIAWKACPISASWTEVGCTFSNCIQWYSMTWLDFCFYFVSKDENTQEHSLWTTASLHK